MEIDELKAKLSEREQEFVRKESDFINGCLSHKKEVAELMARDHRYLVGHRADLCIEYLKVLARFERNGWYDGRNEWACKCARVAIDALIKADMIYIPEEELSKAA